VFPPVLSKALEPPDMEDRPDDRLELPDDEMDGTSYSKFLELKFVYPDGTSPDQ